MSYIWTFYNPWQAEAIPIARWPGLTTVGYIRGCKGNQWHTLFQRLAVCWSNTCFFLLVSRWEWLFSSIDKLWSSRRISMKVWIEERHILLLWRAIRRPSNCNELLQVNNAGGGWLLCSFVGPSKKSKLELQLGRVCSSSSSFISDCIMDNT